MSDFQGLSSGELQRYSRQLMLGNIGPDGQLKLKQANVLVIGLGGLGCPAATYLSACGIGSITLLDGDTVEASNLQRQVLFTPADIGKTKVEAAAEKLAAQNPFVNFNAIAKHSNAVDLAALVKAADLVIDCCDNFASRYHHSDVCRQQQTALISGAAIRWEAQLICFRYDQAARPCYECLYPKSDAVQDSCNSAGIVAPLVGVIGAQQALLAVRQIIGLNKADRSQLHTYDAIHNQWQRLTLNPDPECPCCHA